MPSRLTQRITAGMAIAAAIAVVLVAYAMLGSRQTSPHFKAVDITGVPWGHGFELTDQHGKTRTLADFRGKVVMLFFGYTGCPDMCPTALALLAEAVRQLGPDGERVQVLFATVDPKRDTPQVLSQYVPAFHPAFLGLYADEKTTERTVREFKGYYHANPPGEGGSYTVDHSTQVYVFDPAGRIRLFIKPPEATPQSIAHDVRMLLREAPAAGPAAAQLFGKQQDLLEPEKAFRISARPLDARNIAVEFKIAQGYYMYRDQFRLATESGQPLAGVEIPRGNPKEDAFFGKSEVFRDWVRIRVPVTPRDASSGGISLRVTSQGCSEQGVCYIPVTQTLRVPLPRGKS